MSAAWCCPRHGAGVAGPCSGAMYASRSEEELAALRTAVRRADRALEDAGAISPTLEAIFELARPPRAS